jgi:hypothetical protein
MIIGSDAERLREGRAMADGRSLIQVKFRIRQNVLRKLERAAKRDGRSVNDEIGRRLEESFELDGWREERRNLIAAVTDDLLTHPNPVLTRIALNGGHKAGA